MHTGSLLHSQGLLKVATGAMVHAAQRCELTVHCWPLHMLLLHLQCYPLILKHKQMLLSLLFLTFPSPHCTSPYLYLFLLSSFPCII